MAQAWQSRSPKKLSQSVEDKRDSILNENSVKRTTFLKSDSPDINAYEVNRMRANKHAMKSLDTAMDITENTTDPGCDKREAVK